MPFFSFKKKKEGETEEKKGFLGGIIKKKEQKAEFPVAEEQPPELPELPKETLRFKSVISPSEAELIKEAVAPEPTPKRFLIPKFRPKPKKEPEEEFTEEYKATEEEKPLFVKIDDYRDVMETIKELKLKLKEAGEIITELKRIKEDEDQELQSWHNELESIKNKLLLVDKKLFEV